MGTKPIYNNMHEIKENRCMVLEVLVCLRLDYFLIQEVHIYIVWVLEASPSLCLK